MSLGPAEILVVLVLALIVFGPKRLPEVGRQVGGALRELRKVQDTVQNELRSVIDDTTGPMRSMLPNTTERHLDTEAPSVSDRPELPPVPAPAAAEPDLGDEQRRPPVHESPVANDSDIDRLSGGTFS
jgi:sec-independent protein translocase protein TatA